MARMTTGNAITRSVSRITVSPTQRPKYPAASPSSPPTTSDSPTSSSASGTVTWAPASTRLKTSRPNSSVPNQCPPSGACRRGKSWASGSNGHSTGPSAATTIQSAATTVPVTPSGVRHACGTRVRNRTRSPVGAPVIAELMRLPRCARQLHEPKLLCSTVRSQARSPDPHPRVDQAVEQVDHQVDHDVDDADHQPHAHHPGQVQVRGGLVGVGAHAGPGED